VQAKPADAPAKEVKPKKEKKQKKEQKGPLVYKVKETVVSEVPLSVPITV
jgi:hypothetical protein